MPTKAVSEEYIADLHGDIHGLKQEIAGLTQRRKDLKRFLDIDKEKKEFNLLKKRMQEMVDKSTADSYKILEDAKIHADQIRLKAIADKDIAKQHADRLCEEAGKKLDEAEKKLQSAIKKGKDIADAEVVLMDKEVAFDKKVSDLKKKLIPAVGFIQNILG